MKKHLIGWIGCVSALVSLAMPEEAEVSITQDKMSREVTISYELSEAAIVTFELYTNGLKVARDAYPSAAGNGIAYGRKLEAGKKSVTWKPYLDDWPADRRLPVEAKVKLWATNNPPEYIVCNLATQDDVTYYETADEIPGGVTNYAYKTTHMLLKRVHAAGVPWEMGSPANEIGRDGGREALHPVVLSNDFYLAVYELTQKQVAMITGSRPYSVWGGPSSGTQWWDYPVGSYNSGAFANLFSYDYLRGAKDADGICWPETGHKVTEESLIGQFRARTGLELDLPVEAQWEFAARAGCTTGLYNGFNLLVATDSTTDAHLDPIAWYQGNGKVDSALTTHPVGTREPNAWGFYDMLGNLSEMCVDWYLGNPGDIDFNIGPVTTGSTTIRNRRGGSAVNYWAKTCRVNYRDATGTAAGRYDIGCRFAITLCY